MLNVFMYVKDLVEYWAEFSLISYDFPSFCILTLIMLALLINGYFVKNIY